MDHFDVVEPRLPLRRMSGPAGQVQALRATLLEMELDARRERGRTQSLYYQSIVDPAEYVLLDHSLRDEPRHAGRPLERLVPVVAGKRLAYLRGRPGQARALRSALDHLQRESHGSPGCVDMGVFQSILFEPEFLVFEEFRAHAQQQGMRWLRARTFLAGERIEYAHVLEIPSPAPAAKASAVVADGEWEPRTGSIPIRQKLGD